VNDERRWSAGDRADLDQHFNLSGWLLAWPLGFDSSAVFGVLTEICYFRENIPQIRDPGFIVADGRGYWVKVECLNSSRTHIPHIGVPALQIIHSQIERRCWSEFN